MASAEYLAKLRNFWNTDFQTAKFARVDVCSKSDAEYEKLADRDIAQVLNKIEPKLNWTILEIGCGIGRLLTRMHSHHPSARLIGVDISESMVGFAREAVGNNAELFVTNGSDLATITSDSIDFAYSNDVFIHITDLPTVKSYLRDVNRVLKPGGTFRFNIRQFQLSRAFSNSLGGLYGKAKYALRLRPPLQDTGGINGFYYRLSDAKKLLKEVGLTTISVSTCQELDGGRFWITTVKARKIS
jgi:ubiquinone/menaquinone biosynthesis C-methylase UbiE